MTTTDISLELLLGPQLEAVAAAGYDVIGASAPGPYVGAIGARGVRHVALAHATRANAPARDVRALFELWALMWRERPAIVHTHNPKPGLYGRVAARAARVPVIVNTVHGLYATSDDALWKRSIVYGLERVAATCSHAELVQNAEDLDVLRRLRIPDERLILLGNGVDLARFDPDRVDPRGRSAVRAELGAQDDDVVVGLVGRLVREKGYLEVFEAARLLRSRCPEVRIAVVGPLDSDKADALGRDDLDAARSLGVRFLGLRDDVDRLYRGMDLYVLASHREGFPRSAMEAAAMRLPIVATDIRGCRQVVDDGVTGILVPPRDPSALASAVERLAREPGLRGRMAGAARSKAIREFDQERCIAITLDAYERLLARSPSRPCRGNGR